MNGVWHNSVRLVAVEWATGNDGLNVRLYGTIAKCNSQFLGSIGRLRGDRDGVRWRRQPCISCWQLACVVQQRPSPHASERYYTILFRINCVPIAVGRDDELPSFSISRSNSFTIISLTLAWIAMCDSHPAALGRIDNTFRYSVVDRFSKFYFIYCSIFDRQNVSGKSQSIRWYGPLNMIASFSFNYEFFCPLSIENWFLFNVITIFTVSELGEWVRWTYGKWFHLLEITSTW